MCACLLACSWRLTVGRETGGWVGVGVDQKKKRKRGFAQNFRSSAESKVVKVKESSLCNVHMLLFLCAYTSFHRPCRMTQRRLPSSDLQLFNSSSFNFAWHSLKKKKRKKKPSRMFNLSVLYPYSPLKRSKQMYDFAESKFISLKYIRKVIPSR